MDVHKDSVSVGILRRDEESPDVEKIFNDERIGAPPAGPLPRSPSAVGLLRTPVRGA